MTPDHEVMIEVTRTRATVTLRGEGSVGYNARGYIVPSTQIEAAGRAADRMVRALSGSPAPPARRSRADA